MSDELPICEVCGMEATVLVTIPSGVGTIKGAMCDQHGADVDAYASKVELIP
jgi:hypothetical protein